MESTLLKAARRAQINVFRLLRWAFEERVEPPADPKRWPIPETIIAAIVLAIGTWYTWLSLPFYGIDDAFITYRYALNLVNGEGIVFNPGERVEGYSNLLYLLIMAGGLLVVSPDYLYTFSVCVNVMGGVGVIFLTAHAVQPVGGRFASWTCALMLGFFFPFWIAAWSGLETMTTIFIFTLLWRLAIWRCPEKPSALRIAAAAIVAALLVVSRADGFLMAGSIGAFCLLKTRWKQGTIVTGATLAALGAQVAFRLAYYGYPLPNTFYVKVSGGLADRLNYAYILFGHLGQLHPYAILIAAAAIIGALIVIFNKRNPIRLASFEVLFPIAWIAYWFYVGGDVFRDRLLLCCIPLALGLFYTHVAAPHRPMWFRLAVIAFLIYYPSRFHEWRYMHAEYDPWIAAGKYFGEEYEGKVLAVDAAGKIPYASGLFVIDTMGLNDPEIAHRPASLDFVPGHNKTDMQYVLDRKPDVLVGNMEFNKPEFVLGPTRDMYEPEYKLTKLLRIRPAEEDEPMIIPFNEDREESIGQLQFRGYTYGILERVDSIADE